MHCLALDIGSSSIKGTVLDLDACTTGPNFKGDFPDPIPNQPPGHFEIDPHKVLTAVQELIHKLLQHTPTAEHLFISSQMGGVLLVDDKLRPLTNYLSWRDQRTLQAHIQQSYLELARLRLGDTHFNELGRELKPGSALSLLYWLAENHQLPPRATPLAIGDYIAAALCATEPGTEPTLALGTLNLHTGTWHHAAFDRLGLANLRWPRVVPCDRQLGQFKIAGRNLICHPAVGDQQAALAGVNVQPDELSINISTGSQVSRLTPTLTTTDTQTRSYFDGWFLNTITHLPAGRSLNVLVDLLTELSRAEGKQLSDPWSTIARAVEISSADDSLDVDLAFFSGPMGERGHIGNITTENLTIGNLFSAAFRNMARNYRLCADQFATSAPWSRIVLSGGLSQKAPLLRRLILEAIPSPFRECPAGEDVFLGLLHLARQTNAPHRPHD